MMPIGADTPAQAARKFHRLAIDVQHMDQKVLVESAKTIKASVNRTLLVAAPRRRLNVGKGGAKVGVRYDLEPKKAVVRMTGPAHLLENPTKKHRIPRGTAGRGKRQRANKKVIYIPGIGVRAWAEHPGTEGKKPWARGLAHAKPRLDGIGGKVMSDTVRKVFR